MARESLSVVCNQGLKGGASVEVEMELEGKNKKQWNSPSVDV